MTKRKQFILLNAIALVSYFICWIWLGNELGEEAMFSSTDSKGYLDVVDWIFGGAETPYTEKRPLLYPILIALPYATVGAYGIWFMQFVFWCITVNLTFLSTKKWTGNSIVAWIAVGLLLMNLSLIALTFQGITEVTTAFLLSVFTYNIVANHGKYDSARFGEKTLLILVLLTLVKPLFYYPTLLCLILIIFAYYKQYRINPRRILYSIIILLPLILQMTLVKVKHESFAVSTIGKETFTNYYFSKCVRKIDNLGVEESIAFSNSLTKNERLDYLLEHKGVFTVEFLENILFNIKGESAILKSEFVRKPNLGYDFMKHYNNGSFLVHILGILALIIVFLRAFIRKDRTSWIPLFCIGGLSCYFIVTTGLSFWQGDRLVLPSIALWIPLYATLFYKIVVKSRKRKKITLH